MPNNYFQFKQFIIHQDTCSMKVCTDSCLFGAWIADKLFNKKIIAYTILDIGTGTGLLSLMLAQKTSASIDAVEINENDIIQAKENFNLSPWKNNIHTFCTDIIQWHPEKQYDLIICNPPFYENDLKSPDENKNISKHNNSLNLDDLFVKTSKLLSTDGYFTVLLPFHRSNASEEIATYNSLFCSEKINIRQSDNHNYFRSMLLFQKEKPTHVIEKEISIKTNANAYTKEFTELLKDYYLHL